MKGFQKASEPPPRINRKEKEQVGPTPESNSSFYWKLGEGSSSFLPSSFLPWENKVNSFSNQLKLSWVCKLEWSLTINGKSVHC